MSSNVDSVLDMNEIASVVVLPLATSMVEVSMSWRGNLEVAEGSERITEKSESYGRHGARLRLTLKP